MKTHQDLAAPQLEWVTRFPFSKICIKGVMRIGRKLERPWGWYKKQDPRQQPALPDTPAESPHPSHPPGGTNQTFSSRQKNKLDMNRQSKPQQAPGCHCSFPQGSWFQTALNLPWMEGKVAGPSHPPLLWAVPSLMVLGTTWGGPTRKTPK